MSAWQALHVLGLQHLVESSAGAAIGIGDEDPLVVRASRHDGCMDGRGDAFRPIVKFRWQALDVQCRPAIQLLERDDLAGEGATRDDQDGSHHVHLHRLSALAVSTATAASRQ